MVVLIQTRGVVLRVPGHTKPDRVQRFEYDWSGGVGRDTGPVEPKRDQELGVWEAEDTTGGRESRHRGEPGRLRMCRRSTDRTEEPLGCPGARRGDQ